MITFIFRFLIWVCSIYWFLLPMNTSLSATRIQFLNSSRVLNACNDAFPTFLFKSAIFSVGRVVTDSSSPATTTQVECLRKLCKKQLWLTTQLNILKVRHKIPKTYSTVLLALHSMKLKIRLWLSVFWSPLITCGKTVLLANVLLREYNNLHLTKSHKASTF